MAFERDQGTCCFVLPLKFGVGLISMLVFSQSMLCIVALFTGDIRFQENGYNLHTYRLPSIVGAGGLLFGFLGLLGVYDDKHLWVKAFNRFLVFKLVVMAVAAVADLWTLGKCDSWLNSEEHLKAQSYGHMGIAFTEHNLALDSLAELHVCPWARWAYLIGFGVDFGLWVYCACKTFLFEMELSCNLGYPIDFGNDRHDAEGRWRFYHVKDPRVDALQKPRMSKISEETNQEVVKYGAVETVQELQQPRIGFQGYDAGFQCYYGPDGMNPIDRGMSASGVGFGSIVGSPAAAYSPATAYSPVS